MITKLEDKILDLLSRDTKILTIVKQTGLSKFTIRDIEKRNQSKILKLKALLLKDKVRDKVRELVDMGLTYSQIDKKLKINRSDEIARSIGIRKNEKDHSFWYSMVIKINRDIKRGLPYEELKEKYDFKTNAAKLRYCGMGKILKEYRDARDIEITKQYKRKIAKVVLGVDKKKLNSPNRLKTVGSIYGASSRNGFRKYPNIERGVSGLFVEKAVIKIIKDSKRKGKTLNEISDLLNKKGFVSPMGHPYNSYMVQFKWAKIKKLKL